MDEIFFLIILAAIRTTLCGVNHFASYTYILMCYTAITLRSKQVLKHTLFFTSFLEGLCPLLPVYPH